MSEFDELDVFSKSRKDKMNLTSSNKKQSKGKRLKAYYLKNTDKEKQDEDCEFDEIEDEEDQQQPKFDVLDPGAKDNRNPMTAKNQAEYLRKHVSSDIQKWQIPYWQSETSSLYFNNFSEDFGQEELDYSKIYQKSLEEYKNYYLNQISIDFHQQTIGYMNYGGQTYTNQSKHDLLENLFSTKSYRNGVEIIKIIESSVTEISNLPEKHSIRRHPSKKANFFGIFKKIENQIQELNWKTISEDNEKEFDYELDIFASTLLYTFLTKYTYYQQIIKNHNKGGKSNPILQQKNWFDHFKAKNFDFVYFTLEPFYYNRKQMKEFRTELAIARLPNPDVIDQIENLQYEKVRKHLELGMDPNFCTPLRRLKYPLHIAASKGDQKMVNQLLGYGAEIDVMDTMGCTPLIYAIEANCHRTVEFLIQKGSDISFRDIQQSTPQYMAVFCSDCDMVKLLVKYGANPSVLNFMGRSPLVKAAYLGKIDILDYLLSLDKSLIDHRDDKGRTPLMASCWGIKGGKHGKKAKKPRLHKEMPKMQEGKKLIEKIEITDSPEALTIQLNNGADYNITDHDGNTAIHISCSTSGIKTQKVWYEFFGTDILKLRNETGQDCLNIICEYGHYHLLLYQIDTCKISPISFNSVTNEFMLNTALFHKNFKIVSHLFKTILSQGNLASELIKDHPNIPSDYLRILREKIFKNKDKLLQATTSTKGYRKFLKRDWIQECIYVERQSDMYALIQNDQKSQAEIFLFVVDCVRYQAIEILEYLCTWISADLIKNYITENFAEIIENQYNSADSNIFNKFEELQKFLDKFVTEDKQLSFRDKKNRNIISLCVLHGDNESILYQLKKQLPIELDENTLKKRIDEFFVKDSDGQTFLEYGIINRKVIVTEYLKNMKTNQKIPEIKILGFEIETKSDEILAFEESHINFLTSTLDKIENKQEEAYSSNDITENYTDKLLDIVMDIKAHDKSTYFSQHNLQNPNSKKIEYINKESELKRVVDELNLEPILGIDLEFTYGKFTGVLRDIKNDKNQSHLKDSTQACSVQISSINKNYFIDCLEQPCLIRKYLKNLFEKNSILKILHGADNDIKVLYENYGIILANVFDTSKCWTTLNKMKNSPSLVKIAQEAFGIKVDKTLQCAEWRIRPLPDSMQNYAVCDSFLMIPIFYYFWKLVDQSYIERKGHLKSRMDLFEKTFVKSNGFVRVIQITREIFIEC